MVGNLTNLRFKFSITVLRFFYWDYHMLIVSCIWIVNLILFTKEFRRPMYTDGKPYWLPDEINRLEIFEVLKNLGDRSCDAFNQWDQLLKDRLQAIIVGRELLKRFWSLAHDFDLSFSTRFSEKCGTGIKFICPFLLDSAKFTNREKCTFFAVHLYKWHSLHKVQHFPSYSSLLIQRPRIYRKLLYLL